MSRYINIDNIRITVNTVKDENGEVFVSLTDVRKAIEQTPTADAVDVVRCEDCEHNPNNGGECDRSITHTGRDYVCECNTYRYIRIDYCSYGERRKNNV